MSKKRAEIMLGWDAPAGMTQRPVSFDLDTLLTTHLLLIGASGSGKSYAIRVLAEQCYGELPIIIIDPESEYSSLREKFGFVLVSKEGGDAPATVQSAEMMAHKLLELRASAICALYELPSDEQHAWVRAFVKGLMNAPKELWRPTLVITDESHKFCPEQGEGHSIAKEDMVDLASRGRKHGFCNVFATQRISKLDNNAASECQNYLLGRTFLPVDRDRAAKIFGIGTGKAREEFFHNLKLLRRGVFYGQGVAISADMTTLHVQKAQTKHPEAGEHVKTAPPAPEAIRGILTALAEIPQEAAKKATTIKGLETELKTAHTEIRRLEAVAKLAPKAAVPAPGIDAATMAIAIAADRQETAEALAVLFQKRFDTLIQEFRMKFGRALKIISKEIEEIQGSPFVSGTVPILPVDLGGVLRRPIAKAGRVPVAPASPRPALPVQRESVPSGPVKWETSVAESNGDLKKSQLELLAAMARLDAIGRERVSRRLLAVMAGVSPRSSSFESNLSRLIREGYFAGADGNIWFQPKGKVSAPVVERPATTNEMFEHLRSILSAAQYALIEQLRFAHPVSYTRQELAQRAGVSATSSSYESNVSTLSSLGMVEMPEKGAVKCADWLFID